MRRTVFTHIGLALGFACVLSACGTLSEDEAQNESMVGRVWELTAFEMSHGRTGPGTTLITLQFRDDDRFEGRTTPNIYGGAYQSGPESSLTIDRSSIVSTLVGEPEGSRSEAFFLFLVRATRYEIDGDELTLYCGGNLRLHFVDRPGAV